MSQNQEWNLGRWREYEMESVEFFFSQAEKMLPMIKEIANDFNADREVE